ncbi:MAG: RNA methyltransferase [Deltaproteobacteria bacterium]|nr:RNA methyltransferase [Deltaproteobacteria bacterium]
MSRLPRRRKPQPPLNPPLDKGGIKGGLENISIVLVEPRSAGNVGSVARAMKNTGLTGLRLVNPCEYQNNEGFSMACNASDVLLKAEVFRSIEDAVLDCPVAIGTTRRQGRVRYPVLTLDEALPGISRLSEKNRVAILFGREDKGLKNEEVRNLDMLVEIPTHEDYGSLNLSHAVFIVCHRLFTAKNPVQPAIKVAQRVELERMYEHLEDTLKALDYGGRGNEYLLSAIMRSFRRLFGRTGLMQKEVNMLRGIFTQIGGRLR